MVTNGNGNNDSNGSGVLPSNHLMDSHIQSATLTFKLLSDFQSFDGQWTLRDGWVNLAHPICPFSSHTRGITRETTEKYLETSANGDIGANIDESPVDNADATTHLTLTASPSPESEHNQLTVPEVKVRASSLDR